MGEIEWNSNGDINNNELQTSRRPNKKFGRTALDFNTCVQCSGKFSENGLRQHFNKCTRQRYSGERVVKQLSRAAEGRIHIDACDTMQKKIFAKIQENHDVLAIRYDWIVISYGNDLCLNLKLPKQQRMIRNKMKSAGKLLVAAKLICPDIDDFASMYQVKYCDAVIGAIQAISGFNTEDGSVRAPSTAAALVTQVNTIGQSLLVAYMKRDLFDKENSVFRFLRVFKKDAGLKINKLVAIAQVNAKRGKEEIIPDTDDVRTLATYLDSERQKWFHELSQQYTFKAWLCLMELTAASVMLYNRKRVGDTENIVLKEYNKRKILTDTKNKALLDTLPKETRKMISSRMEIRAKRYRTVAVLFKHSFDECLKLLLRHRKDAGLGEENIYLFGIPSKVDENKTVVACELFRKFSKACGAKEPSSLRGTHLRKHFASTCSTMDLTSNDITNVAKFMGHSKEIHLNVYRHNPLSQEISQMSNLLEVARGRIEAVDEHVIPSSSKGVTQRKRKQKQGNTVVNKKPRKQIKK